MLLPKISSSKSLIPMMNGAVVVCYLLYLETFSSALMTTKQIYLLIYARATIRNFRSRIHTE